MHILRAPRWPSAPNASPSAPVHAEQPVTHNTRFSYAPFAVSSERTDLSSNSFTPGVGEYSLSAAARPAGVGATAFASRTNRFEPSRSAETPGPGHYSVASAKPPRKKRPPTAPKQEGVQFVRVFQPPSIPSVSQSYGYEETKEGDLVPQRPPVRGFSGTRDDSIGPDAYSKDWAAVSVFTCLFAWI